MKFRIVASLSLVLLSCGTARNTSPTDPFVATPRGIPTGPRHVLAERTVTFAEVPLTVRLCALDANPTQQIVEVEARPRRLDWELYAETERVGATTVVLVKLFEPGPGAAFVPTDAPLRSEIALDAPVDELPIRVTHWLLNAEYGRNVSTQWVDAGTLVIADAAGQSR